MIGAGWRPGARPDPGVAGPWSAWLRRAEIVTGRLVYLALLSLFAVIGTIVYLAFSGASASTLNLAASYVTYPIFVLLPLLFAAGFASILQRAAYYHERGTRPGESNGTGIKNMLVILALLVFHALIGHGP